MIRFFQYETQLGPVLPKQDIANHLQQLAQLYQSSSPVLSDIYTLLSCLSPEQLPGEPTDGTHGKQVFCATCHLLQACWVD